MSGTDRRVARASGARDLGHARAPDPDVTGDLGSGQRKLRGTAPRKSWPESCEARRMLRPSALAITLSSLALILLVVTACSSEPDATPSDGDSKCCPMSTPPLSCSGYALGGSRAKNPTCGFTFDDVPPPSARSVDADGCPIWEYGGAPLPDVAYSCNSPRLDAGVDAPAGDAARD